MKKSGAPIFQGLARSLFETIKPLVGGLPRDTKLAAGLGNRGGLIQDTVYKCDSLLRHGNNSFPGHDGLLPSATLQEGDHHAKVLPMCLHNL